MYLFVFILLFLLSPLVFRGPVLKSHWGFRYIRLLSLVVSLNNNMILGIKLGALSMKNMTPPSLTLSAGSFYDIYFLFIFGGSHPQAIRGYS